MTNKIQEILNSVTSEQIKRIKGLIDPCSFGTVIDHYLHDNQISFVVIVPDGFDLAHIGAIIVDAPLDTQDQLYVAMFRNGMIQAAFEDKRDANDIMLLKPVRFVEIGRRLKVYVYYAPPFYIVKLTKDQWI